MNKNEVDFYRCPESGGPLKLEIAEISGNEVVEGKLVNQKNIDFPIENGVPNFTWPQNLGVFDQTSRAAYDELAEDYEKFADIPFRTYRCSEADVRKRMIDQLEISSGDCILEVGAGDGRASEIIANRLEGRGRFYIQELSKGFLDKAIQRLANHSIDIEFSIANASYLPFADNMFDAAHHFGGINTFDEVARCLEELARVVRPGGKVVVGDEGLGPWLRETEFGQIMSNSNPLLKYEVPFSDIPVSARDVRVDWIMMGAFFTLEFTVGEGEPQPNYHIKIPSERGGSHWSRYFGVLEGVSDEAKSLATRAREAKGLSMADWLEVVVREAASRDLEGK